MVIFLVTMLIILRVVKLKLASLKGKSLSMLDLVGQYDDY